MFTIPEKTKEDFINDALIQINKHAIDCLENKKINYQIAFNLVWQPINCKPQDIFDLMGTQAVELFQKAEIEITSILALDPTYTPPMPADVGYPDYRINKDGTVDAGDYVDPNPVTIL